MAFEGLSGYFAWHSDALLPLVAVDALRSDVSCRCRRRQQPQFRDQSQNLLDHLPWDCDLGHLEDNIAAVAHHLGADLDQLLLEGGQRPITHRLRRRQRAQEIAEVVGERMKLEPLWRANAV